ncbi:unnamed protein product [Callosobruchus maculatus]|uniref:Uncharacterized protein n=1 Tax=Callosobruchus maculatus TaxID=64391 RepID=A0A653DQH5_CALMS|nr:unnamed protein product [Callosobruchus maculatus]
MDEKLIEAVKRYPCLWDISSTYYKCNETKDAAWAEIVKEIKFGDVQSAKSRWKQLRDCHRDALKRQKSKKSGQPTAKIHEWKYQRLMEYLLPYMSNRDRESNFRESPSSITPTQDDSSQSSLNKNNDSLNSVRVEIGSSSGMSANSRIPSSLKKKKGDELSNLLTRHMESQEIYRRERKELKELLKQTEHDDIDLFFLSMAKTYKKLPHYVQVPVKRKIFNIISDAEESCMMPWYNPSSDYSPSSASHHNMTSPVELSYSQECMHSPPQPIAPATEHLPVQHIPDPENPSCSQ